MINSMVAARAVCEFKEWDASNLVLHKILYIAHGTYMAEQGEGSPLIDGYFEAWDYGPVVPSLYRRFKMFGADPIESYVFLIKYESARNMDRSRPEIQHIKKIVRQLAGYPLHSLITMTHAAGGAWEKAYAKGLPSSIISNSSIFDEYKSYRQQ